jgi:hypothetical protein
MLSSLLLNHRAVLKQLHQAAAAAAPARFSPVPHLLLRRSLNMVSPLQLLVVMIMMWVLAAILPLRRS